MPNEEPIEQVVDDSDCNLIIDLSSVYAKKSDVQSDMGDMQSQIDGIWQNISYENGVLSAGGNILLKKLYQTTIEINNAPVNRISYNSTNTITVRLTDFNNAPVVGESVTLLCDGGYFEIDNTHSEHSVTKSTNSNGEIFITWKANNPGLVTFRANNVKREINVIGLSHGTTYEFPGHAGNVVVYDNGYSIFVAFNSVHFNCLRWSEIELGAIDPASAPQTVALAIGHYVAPTIVVSIHSDGKIIVRNNSNNDIVDNVITTSLTYPIKK